MASRDKERVDERSSVECYDEGIGYAKESSMVNSQVDYMHDHEENKSSQSHQEELRDQFIDHDVDLSRKFEAILSNSGAVFMNQSQSDSQVEEEDQ